MPNVSLVPLRELSPASSTLKTPGGRRGPIRSGLLLTACVASLSLSACSASVGGKSMSQADVEKQSAIELSKVVGVPASQVPAIKCPSDLTAKVGTKMTCSIGEAPGKVYDMYVTVTKVTESDSHVFFDVKVSKTPRA